MGDERRFSPVICVVLKAVLSDTITEFLALKSAAQCSATLPQASLNVGQKVDPSTTGTILQELNKVFFETLIRFEKCRREDYIELEDGNFRKLNENESSLRTFLEEVGKVTECLKLLVNEIEERGTFETLVTQCDIMQTSVDVLVDLAKASLEKEELIGELRAKINVALVEYANQRELYCQALRRTRNEWQDARQLSQMTVKFLWECYRQKAATFNNACNTMTKQLVDEASHLRRKINQSKRQTAETMSWLFTELDTETNRLRYLHSRDDVTKLAARLTQLQTDLEQKITEHTDLKKEFAKCEAVVIDYRNEMEKKRIQDEYAHKYMICVLQVQAWWRTLIEVKGIKLKKKKKGKAKAGGKKK